MPYSKRVNGNPFLSFKSKYKIIESGCWEWQASLTAKGYPQLNLGKGKITYAHRYSYMQFVGEIKEGLFVCHKCDNPKCVNPFHFFLGTNEDNMKDAKRKGRLQQVTHPHASLFRRRICLCIECEILCKIVRKAEYWKNKTPLQM